MTVFQSEALMLPLTSYFRGNKDASLMGYHAEQDLRRGQGFAAFVMIAEPFSHFSLTTSEAVAAVVLLVLARWKLIPDIQTFKEKRQQRMALDHQTPSAALTAKTRAAFLQALKQQRNIAAREETTARRRLTINLLPLGSLGLLMVLLPFFLHNSPTMLPAPSTVDNTSPRVTQVPPSNGEKKRLDSQLEKRAENFILSHQESMQRMPSPKGYPAGSFGQAAEAFLKELRENAFDLPVIGTSGNVPVASVTLEGIQQADGTFLPVKYLFINSKAMASLLPTALINPVKDVFLAALIVKEGAMLSGLNTDAPFYLNKLEDDGTFQLRPFNIRDKESRELAKRAAAKNIRSEEVGYILAARYVEEMGYTGPPLASLALSVTDPWLKGIINRFSIVLTILETREGPDQRLALRQNILDVDLQSSTPKLYQAIKEIIAKGHEPSLAHPERSFLIDDQYLQGKRPTGPH